MAEISEKSLNTCLKVIEAQLKASEIQGICTKPLINALKLAKHEIEYKLAGYDGIAEILERIKGRWFAWTTRPW